jgi:hypothetical protein
LLLLSIARIAGTSHRGRSDRRRSRQHDPSDCDTAHVIEALSVD